MFAIDSMCCKNVAIGRQKASRPDPAEKEKPLDVASRQCGKGLKSCSRPTIYFHYGSIQNSVSTLNARLFSSLGGISQLLLVPYQARLQKHSSY